MKPTIRVRVNLATSSLILLILGPLALAPRAVAQSAPLPHFGHVVTVVEENHNYNQVVHSAAMPYLNSLISQYGLATNYTADTHPSIGNYFMLTTGQVLTNDDSQTPATFPVSADNIVRELVAAGKTWKCYAEGLPSVGYTGGDTGSYYVRHNPLAYLTDVQNDPTQAQNLVPFTQFATDLANGTLPNYSFIVPNACNDAHGCPLRKADDWLQANIDPLIKSSMFQADGLLAIVFDENSNSSGSGCTDSEIHGGTWCGGQVATVVVSPTLVSAGYQSSNSYHHEDLLRLTAQGLGLTTYPGDSSTAADMSDFFAVPAAVSLSATSLAFAGEIVGSPSTAQSLTLKNGTKSPLSVSGIAISGTNSGDFAENNSCGSSVAAGASCAISVTFNPSASGSRTATLTITDSGSNSPQVVPLSGTGEDFALSTDVSSRAITAGQAATFTLSVTPQGGFNQVVSFGCTGAPQLAQCSIVPASVTLNGSNPSTATLTVTTTARAAAPPPGTPPGPRGWPRVPPLVLWLGLLTLLASCVAYLVSHLASKRLRPQFALPLALAGVLAWVACGGGAEPPPSRAGTAPGTYKLTISGSAGSLSHNATVSLTVS